MMRPVPNGRRCVILARRKQQALLVFFSFCTVVCDVWYLDSRACLPMVVPVPRRINVYHEYNTFVHLCFLDATKTQNLPTQ